MSVSPTFKPQTVNAMDKVRMNLERSAMTREHGAGAAGFMLEVQGGTAAVLFGGPWARGGGCHGGPAALGGRGARGGLGKVRQGLDPMTASTNATWASGGRGGRGHAAAPADGEGVNEEADMESGGRSGTMRMRSGTSCRFTGSTWTGP